MLNFGSMRAPLAAMLLAGAALGATPASAQQIGAETPTAALSRYIRVLASSPRDFNALIGAGQAALELGDVQAAAGFFGRAEEANPNAPGAKIGLGAAMVHMGDPDGAIYYFNQASRLGAQPMTMAIDRGMARDLLGDLRGAQADYRLAIASLASDEARRRLALSLAIGRNKQAAIDILQPLLNRHDPAAQRTRAFVLALVGDQIAAMQAIDSVMPGTGARFAPFFRYLPNLSITEKAAAVHLGIFPEDASTRVASIDITQPQVNVAAQPPVRIAANTARPKRQVPQRQAEPSRPSNMASAARTSANSDRNSVASAPVSTPTPSFSLPSAKVAAASPSFSPPSASGAPPTETANAPVETKADPAEPAVALAETEEVAAESKLSGIDKLLATISEAPPPPQPKLELTKPTLKSADPKATKAAKAAADKKAAEKKAREEKLAEEKKAKEEAAKLGIKGTYWVQLAGGSNQDRMAKEYKKLSGKAGKLLKSRSGYVTVGKDYFRLLVGPFDSKGDSQAFVNKLEKEGVDGFSWTRTPPKIKIEKLSST